MNDGERILRELTARDPERLLEELSELAKRVRAGQPLRRPRVTVMLSNGRDLSGFVLALAREGAGTSVLLHLPGESAFGTTEPTWDVAHVPMRSIDAVIVHDVVGLSKPPADAPPPPSRSEFKRRLAGAESALAVQVGATIAFELQTEPDETDLEPLGSLLPQVTEILETIGRDEVGRSRLQARVKRLHLAVGPAPHVTLVGDALTVVAVAEVPRRLSKMQLARAIDAAL